MYSEYLKTTLKRIADSVNDIAAIEERYATAGRNGTPCYPSMVGALEAVIRSSVIYATTAKQWVTNHIEPAEREAQRLVSILEGLGIDTEEETLATLELIASDNTYRDERRQLRSVFSRVITEAQESQRESEKDDATDAITATGFAFDEEADNWNRGNEQIRIELTNGNESRYKWEYETSDPLHRVETGVSGEFSRLLALIQSKEVKA